MKATCPSKARPRVIFGVLSVAIGLLLILALVSRGPQSRPAPESARGEEVRPTKSDASEPRTKAYIVRHRFSPASDTAQTGTDDDTFTGSPAEDFEHESYVQARIAEWNALAAQDAARAQDAVLAEMTNPDKEIRYAALDSIIQSQDQSAISRLHEIAAITKDAEEKAAILDTIKFMSLPSLTDTSDAGDQNQTESAPPDHPQSFPRFHALLDARLRPIQGEKLPQVGQ